MSHQKKKQIKVIYNTDIKKFTLTDDYEALLTKVKKQFKITESVAENLKFRYLDDQQDILTVECQDDFEQAIELDASENGLKLVYGQDQNHARIALQPTVQRQSNTMLQLNDTFEQAISDIRSESVKCMDQQFITTSESRLQGTGSNNFDPFDAKEDKSIYLQEHNEESKLAQSVSALDTERTAQTDNAKGSNKDLESEVSKVVNQETETKNLVEQQHMACGTEQLQTENMGINTQTVQMNETGSQATETKNVNEVGCDAKIHTEEQSIQKDIVGKDAEVNCEIIQIKKDEEEAIYDTEPVDCFKCEGSRVSKKGKECKRCGGTGQIKNKMIQQILDILREDIKTECYQNFQRMFKDYLDNKKHEQSQVIHAFVTCNKCGCCPIQGIRYQCTQNSNFNICERCEEQNAHPYPLIKFRNPSQVPQQLVCKMQEEESNGFNPQKKVKEEPILYIARFIKESFGDKHEILPNESFTKSWTFRNDGDHAWPLDTIFMFTNGDNLQCVPTTIGRQVHTGESITIEVKMTSPQLAGNYEAFFRFTYGDSQRFGQKVWCNILVIEPENNVARPSVLYKPSNQQNIESENNVDDCIQPQQIHESQNQDKVDDPIVEDRIQPAIVIQEDKMKQEEPVVSNPHRSSLLDDFQVEDKPSDDKEDSTKIINPSEQPFVRPDVKTLTEQYLNRVCDAKDLSQKEVDTMIQLGNMGFIKYEINLKTLRKFNCEINMAINCICNGVDVDKE